MTRRQLKKQLRDAVLSTTPDVLDKVLSATPQQIAAAKEFKEELPVRKNHFKAAASAVAALFVFVMGAVFFSQPKVDSIVSIDVNPSFELSVDNRDRVLECTAVNDEAAKVLEGMTLEKIDLDTATAQIISSMRTHGYLAPEKTDNTILISVANSDVKKAEELKNKVSASVSTALKSNQTSARLIQQSDVLTPEVQKFAKEQGISVGKADLVKKLSEKDSELDPNTLSNLSITEISSIIDEKDIDVSDVLTEYTPEQQGEEPSGGNASSEGTTSSEAPPSSNSPEGSGESSESPASSEQPSSKPSDSGDTPVIDSGKYCEYCGKLSTVCQGKCSHKNGKLYCPDCGNSQSLFFLSRDSLDFSAEWKISALRVFLALNLSGGETDNLHKTGTGSLCESSKKTERTQNPLTEGKNKGILKAIGLTVSQQFCFGLKFYDPPMPPSRYQGASTYGRRRILTGSCADYLAGRDAAVL